MRESASSRADPFDANHQSVLVARCRIGGMKRIDSEYVIRLLFATSGDVNHRCLIPTLFACSRREITVP